MLSFQGIEIKESTSEVAQELKPQYVEVLKALMKCEQQGYFPMKQSGQITLHFNHQGTLAKVVPSVWIKAGNS